MPIPANPGMGMRLLKGLPPMAKQTPSDLLIGLATCDITPPVGATLVGYKPRASTSLAHALRAEALFVKDAASGAAWVLVTSDMIGYPREYVNQVRAKVAQKTDLAPEALLISGTHTHSGPAVTYFGTGTPSDLDTQYLTTLQGRLVDLVAAAMAAAQPGTFEVAWTEAPTLGSNRRIEGPDGKWINEWIDADGKHPGYFDPAVLLVAVRRPGGSLDRLLVNYGCHPVVLGPQSLAISADYVGYMKDALEASGKVASAAFALAGGGNINPRFCIQEGAEHPKAMGQKLAAIVLTALDKLRPVAPGRVVAHQQEWNVVRTRDSMKRKDRPHSQAGDTIPTEIQAFRAGDLGLVSLPGELFSEYAKWLREAAPTRDTLVVSLANDYIGYLPTDQAQAEGAYETNMAPAEALEKSLLAAAAKAFKAIT